VAPPPAAPDPATTLALGDVEANTPIRRIRWIQPLADHLAALPDELRQQMQVVARTESLPRQLVSVRPGLDPELVSDLRDHLLGLTDADRELLAAAVAGGGWTWVFEELSDESRQQLERFTDTVDLLLRIED
jgi:ABC-type phosphate/phosphonate transport system substrate-binding protein